MSWRGFDRTCHGFDRQGTTPSRPTRETASLADLFKGRSQLLVYHFMFGPDFTAGCPSCSAIRGRFLGFGGALANHDVAFTAVSRAPLAKLQGLQAADGAGAFRGRPHTKATSTTTFTYSTPSRNGSRAPSITTSAPLTSGRPRKSPGLIEVASGAGTDPVTLPEEGPGMSAFAIEDGVVFHTYAAYGRGLDGLWGMYSWLDPAPRSGATRPACGAAPRRIRRRLSRRSRTDLGWRREREAHPPSREAARRHRPSTQPQPEIA